MSLGKTIVSLREKKHWSQKELADRLDVHPRHVSRWETDKVRPRARALEKLAATLEVPLGELLGESLANRQLEQGLSPELAELLAQLHKLGPEEQNALRVFLDAMLARVRLEDALRPESKRRSA